MHNRQSLAGIGAILLCGVLLAPALFATTYNCSPIIIPGGGNAVSARGINNAGTIVGSYQLNAIQHGFIANPAAGNFQTVDYPQPPGSTNTQLFTINNNGVSVGSWSNTQNGTSGYFTLDSAGTFSPLNVPAGFSFTNAYGINDNGAISGIFSQPSTGTSGFGILNPDGTITPVPGYNNSPNGGPILTAPGSLNNAGQMMESSTQYGGAALASASGVIVNLQYLQASTYGYGVNNLGTIAGYAFGLFHEPPYVDFTYDLNSQTYSPAFCPTYSPGNQPGFFAINDHGVLAGQAIATPLPGSAQFSISTTSLTFPPTPVGQTTAPQPVTITNTGNARLDMYAGGGVVFGTSGTTTAVFRGDTGCFADNGLTVRSLDPGASCTTMITATPNAQGQQTATEYITDSAPGEPHTFSLSVTGTVPPPSCTIATTASGASLTMQDANSGLSSIVLLDSTNANVSIPNFASGTTSPVTATASQVNGGQPSRVDLRATNVAGGSTVCGTSFGGSNGPPTWTGLGGSFTGMIAIATNSDGRLQAFTRGTDNALWTIAQTAPDGAWSPWTSIGGVLGSDPAVGVNSDGRLEVFALGNDSSLWTIAQSSPGAGFSGWQGLGNTLSGTPSVATNSDGRLQVFARGTDNALWTIAQTSAGGTWNSWLSLGGVLANDATPAIVNTNGSMEVFVIGTDNGVWHQWQLTPGGADWSGWNGLGGSIVTVRPVINTGTGLVELTGLGTDNSYWSISHASGSGWGAWTSLGGFFTSAPSALFDSNGLLEIFGRGGDNALYRTTATQADPPFNFTGWAPLGGTLANGPTAALNQDGRVAVFVEGVDSALWTIEQSQAGTW